MGAGILRGRSTGNALTRQFGILSLIVTGLITLALSLVLSFYLRKDLLEREWSLAADYVRTEAFYHLSVSDFVKPWAGEARQHFEDFYRQTVTMPEIVRVKIYDPSMAVIWSDEPRLLGQRFPDNLHLRGAMAGRTVVNIGTQDQKGENVYERNHANLVEVYVPIVFPGTSHVAGVVETYKAPIRVFANIRQGQLTVLGTALAGGAFLYLSLFWIVRRAAQRIDEQHLSLISANAELRAVQAQLLEAERMAATADVVTAVAHGIRNPLANIRALAEVATLDCGACEVASRGIGKITGEVDRMERRLRELLQFVRPAERERQPVELHAVLRESLQLMAGRIAGTSVTVITRFAPSLPRVLGDAILFEQVFLGLIGNAIDAIPDGKGTVTIITGTVPDEGDGRRVFVEVEDTGAGVPPEIMPKLFDPFYTTKAQGTGLGLAIAKKFTEAYGGTISVRSRPRPGATFRVAFPAEPTA